MRRGFTLLDLMISLALLSVIMATVYFVFANQERNLSAASESRDTFGQGRLIMDMMSRDLAGAWLPDKGAESPAAHIKYRFFGQVERVDMVSSNYLTTEAEVGENLAEVGYRLEQTDEAETWKLIRRQQKTPDDDITTGGREFVLSSAVRSLQLAYVAPDGNVLAYVDAVERALLPRAVRIRVALAAPGGGEVYFATVAELPVGWPTVPRIQLPAGLGGF